MKRSQFIASNLAIVVCAGAAAFAPLGGGVFAWGYDGHRIVGEIASP